MPVDAGDTIAALGALRARLAVVGEQIAGKSGLLVLATGQRLTHVRSGALRRSWRMVGPTGGDGVYSAEVGPTMIYARRQELGFLPPLTDSLGRSFPHDPGWPYVKPAHELAYASVGVLATRMVAEVVSGG